MRKTTFALSLSTVALGMAAIAMAPASAAEQVGVTSAVKTNAAQAMAGAGSQSLGAQAPIFRDATLTTDVTGSLEVTFADGSQMSMVQNAVLEIDKLTYPGPAASGAQVLNASRGFFRMISGTTPKDNVKINTPVATIGIRGTILRWRVFGDGATWVGCESSQGSGAEFPCFVKSKVTGQTVDLKEGDKVRIDAEGNFGDIESGIVNACDK